MGGDIIRIVEQRTVIRLVQPDTKFIRLATPGPQGPAGTPLYQGAIAGENINIFFGLALIGGLAYNVDTTNLSHVNKFIGIATQSSLSGTMVSYMQMSEIYELGGFVTGARYFLGNGGRLTTNPDEVVGALWKKSIGIARDADHLVLCFGPTVILA
jgi:hypothetical protein